MNSNRKPALVNLLAGARSYELQIWWEIRSTVAEVFPRSSRTYGGPAEPGKEDDREARAEGRVKPVWVVKRHTSRDEQSEVGHRSYLGNCDAAGSLSRCQMRGASSKAGPKQIFEFQNDLRIRGSKEEPKSTHLRDTIRERNGPHLECVVAQGPCLIQGVVKGLCPLSLGEQSAWPTVRNSKKTQRA